MALSENQVEITNWSKANRSACWVVRIKDKDGLLQALHAARSQGLPVIPHGAGHSYTDAALNTGGVVVDVTPMRRILSWDASTGVICVEPGLTLQELIEATWPDGWWPTVMPSTPLVTVGGCVAMNVNGRNSWKTGPFGQTVLSLDVILPTGEALTLRPGQETQLFQAFVGSAGLLGFITSITLQLQSLASGHVFVRRHSATSLDGIFDLFDREEAGSDFMEAWLDGFAGADRLGRGHLTCATWSESGQPAALPFPNNAQLERLEGSVVGLAARLVRPALAPGMKLANQVNYWSGQRAPEERGRLRQLVPYSFWPAPAFSGYPAMFPHGVESFQAFIPGQAAPEICREVLRHTQKQGCFPLWSILKKHRRDDFLLSYQLDGFSLELNFTRSGQAASRLQPVLQQMISIVVDAGGRFYFAKDRLMTSTQFRQSVGGTVVDAYLRLKRRLDPETRLQSDLFRRLFQPAEA